MKTMRCRLILLAFSVSILFLSVISYPSSVPAAAGPLESFQYHTYSELSADLATLAQQHPDIMQLSTLGQTYEGRELWLVKLSRNVTSEESEPGVLFMGAHHGNEKPGYEAILFFIRYMVENDSAPNTDNDGDGAMNEDPIDGADNDGDAKIDEDPSEEFVRELLNSTQIYCIPMVNPDGVEANSRKNCAPNHGPFGLAADVTSYGVNLNRNYDDYWFLYYLFPMHYGLPFCLYDESFNYRGPRPFSEVETQAVRDFALSHNLSVSISYHTYGEFIIYPWMHTSEPAPDEDTFISLGENISRINDYTLFIGNDFVIPRLGGTLGTSEQWLYKNRGVYAFTIELCEQRAPTNEMVMQRMMLTQTGVHLYLCQRAQTLPPSHFAP